jgi:hypothetical protein
MVDRFIETEDSVNTSEYSAFQAIIKGDEGKPLSYRQLLQGPDATEWQDHSSQEWDRLIEGTATLRFVPASTKPRHQKAAYIKHVCIEKIKPPGTTLVKRVRTTAGGDKIEYSGDKAANTAGLKTIKTLWNSVLSTYKAKFMTIDVKDFYLNTRLQTPEYAWVTLAQIPPATQAKYHIDDLVVNGKVLVEINGGIYGLNKISSSSLLPTATT